MNPRRKYRLLVAGAVLCGMSLTAGLVLYALSASIDLFYTPEEIHFGIRETGQRPVAGQRLRVGGMVKAGSVKRSTETLAKHDENYTPPEVKKAMQDNHYRAGREAL